jgi:hypothetical protein
VRVGESLLHRAHQRDVLGSCGLLWRRVRKNGYPQTRDHQRQKKVEEILPVMSLPSDSRAASVLPACFDCECVRPYPGKRL